MSKPVDPAIAFLDSLQAEFPPETPLSRQIKFNREHEAELKQLEDDLRESDLPSSNPYDRNETL
jgi:hypothetical protein